MARDGDRPPALLGAKEWVTIAIAAVAAVGSMAVSQYRVGQVEADVKELSGDPLKLALLERDVKALGCEIKNVKRIVRNQPEQDC
jgi:hypothetical protein